MSNNVVDDGARDSPTFDFTVEGMKQQIKEMSTWISRVEAKTDLSHGVERLEKGRVERMIRVIPKERMKGRPFHKLAGTVNAELLQNETYKQAQLCGHRI